MKQKISITINDKILRDVDSIVDNIYIRNRSQAFEYLIKRAFKERKIAVILAGESKNNPANELKHRYSLKVNHSTIVEKTIRKLSDSGFKKIYIVSDHLTLTNIFKIIGDGSDFKTHIEFIDEEIQEGSSSALKLLKGKIKTTFLVIQCDLIIDYIDLLELWQNHLKENVAVTMLVCSSITPTKKAVYGHVNLQGNKVLIYQEKPTKEKLKSSIFFGGVFCRFC